MTKTVEELQADFERAKEASRTADALMREARIALDAGLLAATGLAGHKVAYPHKDWRRPSETRFLLVSQATSLKVSGRRILKDGSVGTMQGDAYIVDVTDLGLYVPTETK